MRPRQDHSAQLTVTATTLDWVNEPDVPVTVKLTALDAGVVGLLFELLPHPTENIETSSSSPNVVVHTILLRVRGFRLRVVRLSLIHISDAALVRPTAGAVAETGEAALGQLGTAVAAL